MHWFSGELSSSWKLIGRKIGNVIKVDMDAPQLCPNLLLEVHIVGPRVSFSK